MQYRLLSVGETIQRGDEYYNHRTGWQPIRVWWGAGKVQPKGSFRCEVGGYRRPQAKVDPNTSHNTYKPCTSSMPEEPAPRLA